MLFSSAPEELLKPKSQVFGGGKTARRFALWESRSSRNAPSVAVQGLEVVVGSFLPSRVNATGASADC